MIRELRTLIAITQHGTFAAAADRLHVTQAAVSAQMKRLEAELGFSIFERQGRNTVLNMNGKRVLLQASDILSLYDQLVEPKTQTTRHILTIGAIASMQRNLLPQAIANLHLKHPNNAYRIVPGLSIELLDRLDTGELDAAVMIKPPFPLSPNLQWVTMVREPFVVIAHERRIGGDYIDLLTRYPFIRYDRSSFGGRQVDRFLKAKQLVVDERIEIDELDAITEFVSLDLGIALVPKTAALLNRPDYIRVIELHSECFYREIGCAYNTTASGEAITLVSTLIDFLAMELDRSSLNKK